MANDGGPAFPSSNDVKLGDIGTHGHAGMSLRDFFAGQALAGWLASFSEDEVVDRPSIVTFAYGIADAMLAEREAKADGSAD